MSPASAGRVDGASSSVSQFHSAASLPWACSMQDRCPQGFSWPRVVAVFSGAGVGRAGAPSQPGGNRLFPASRGSSWRKKGRAGSHGNGSRRERTVAREQFLQSHRGHPPHSGGCRAGGGSWCVPRSVQFSAALESKVSPGDSTYLTRPLLNHSSWQR